MAVWVAGVDGCPHGWVAAFLSLDGVEAPRVRIAAHMGEIVDSAEAPAIVAVDMPIGLPDRIAGSGRGPERLIRPLLGGRQSCVFAIPSRDAVHAPDYRSACAAALSSSDPPRKVSKQGFMLFPKIREIDALLRQRPDLAGRVFEVHPELAFWTMNGEAPLAEPKKAKGRPHPDGLALRRGLLVAAGLDAGLVEAPPPRGAAADDYLDALAALLVARHIHAGNGRSFPDEPDSDGHGLPVAIWSYRRNPVMDRTPCRLDGLTMPLPVSKDDIRAAYRRIAAHVRRTPVLDLPNGAFGLANRLSLKLELLQHAGSFKPRGAFNTILSNTVPAAGVAAASGGNHGAAVAYAARQRGVPARIFVPEIASPAKIAAICAFGADIVIGGARYADAQEACDRFVATTGALRVHPFDAEATIAGQASLALEWEAQVEAEAEPQGLDTVLVAVGGGGLIAGLASWWHGSKVKVVGVEPAGSCALHAALAAGGPVDVPVESIAADSLGARNVGALVHAIAAAAVDHVALVADAAIVDAQKALWRDLRLAVEPGGATALAALLCGAYRPAPGERVGVLICGGNVALSALAAAVSDDPA